MSMALTVPDAIRRRLAMCGVKRVYGYPDDIAAGLLDALERSPYIEFVKTRHQEAAAFGALPSLYRRSSSSME
jgi:thiamine pyrophosphate-dependent acetolactate synthase large subunit-like protein